MGFVATHDLISGAISNKILEILEPLQLDPELCVGFSVDSASLMAGSKGVVQEVLEGIFPHAVYTQCNSHRLNLVPSSASKVSPTVAIFFEILNSLHHFMTGVIRHAWSRKNFTLTDLALNLNIPQRLDGAQNLTQWVEF